MKPGKHYVVDIKDADEWIEKLKKSETQKRELQELIKTAPTLTAEQAREFFNGCARDEDGNYICLEEE